MIEKTKIIRIVYLSYLLLPVLALAQGKGGKGKGGRQSFRALEQQAIDEGFTGLTTKGSIQKDLYRIRSTGVSTAPVKIAAEAFLKSLSEEQRKKTTYTENDDEWRKWANQHSYVRQGVSFEELNDTQREAAFYVMESSLSAQGLKNSRDIMRLNETIAELKRDWDGYGEWKYHLTIMGTPSTESPWGWQIDGHHLVINYFILGDQVVMSPVFIGSEPVWANSGKYKGTIIMQKEQDAGLKFMRSLSAEQQAIAKISSEKGPTNTIAEAFKDNLVVDYTGIKGAVLTEDQKSGLLDLIGTYINHQKEGHANLRMQEVKQHIADTHFSWIGETNDDSVFYYRVYSPVIFIEFDHQRPIGLERTGRPTRNHIHAVMRTPNGNDYGKSLLKQHYEKHHKK